MKRKVIKHGPGTMIVSLPSKWVKKNSVAKGSEVDVNEENNKIVISTEYEEKPQEVTVDITGLDRTSILRIIRSLYRLGYDVVHVKFDKLEAEYQREKKLLNVLSVIHTEVNMLIGFEIIQEREKSCTIKDIQSISARDFDQVLRRIFLLLTDTMHDFLEGIRTNNKSLLETIEKKHDTITKFVSYCLRILNKKGYEIQRKTSYYYFTIATLERITDIIKFSAADAREHKGKFSLEIIKIFEIINNDLKKYYELFYSYNNKKIAEINGSRYLAETAVKNLPATIKRDEALLGMNMFMILEVIVDLIEARTALEY